jgi:hypothetical protein
MHDRLKWVSEVCEFVCDAIILLFWKNAKEKVGELESKISNRRRSMLMMFIYLASNEIRPGVKADGTKCTIVFRHQDKIVTRN